MYNMVPYNSNVMNVEDDITNIFTIRQKRNVYHREDNKCGDNFIMIILDESHQCKTAIYENQEQLTY